MTDINHNRRDFLKRIGLGSLGLIAINQLNLQSIYSSDPEIRLHNFPGYGLQLYTIREDMKTNVRNALKKVAEIGYSSIELAGYENGKFYGFEPGDFKKIASDLGLEIASSHTAVEQLGIQLDNAKIMTEAHARLGTRYCVQPWIVEEKRKTLDSYKGLMETFNKVGEVMNQFNIRFAYHNHDFDFDTVEGKIPYYDVFLKESDPNLVNFEIDLYWAIKAGQDPVKIFSDYPGRFPLWHVKDMENSPDKFFAAVGEGTIDFKRIFAAKDLAGMKYYFVEQDATRDNKPFDAIQTSINNLNTKILSK